MALAVAEYPIGFLGWTRSHDLHHCVSGGSICDAWLSREQHEAPCTRACLPEDRVQRCELGGTATKISAVIGASTPVRLVENEHHDEGYPAARIRG